MASTDKLPDTLHGLTKRKNELIAILKPLQVVLKTGTLEERRAAKRQAMPAWEMFQIVESKIKEQEQAISVATDKLPNTLHGLTKRKNELIAILKPLQVVLKTGTLEERRAAKRQAMPSWQLFQIVEEKIQELTPSDLTTGSIHDEHKAVTATDADHKADSQTNHQPKADEPDSADHKTSPADSGNGNDGGDKPEQASKLNQRAESMDHAELEREVGWVFISLYTRLCQADFWGVAMEGTR